MASSIMKSVLIFITMLLQLISCFSWPPVTFIGGVGKGAGKGLNTEKDVENLGNQFKPGLSNFKNSDPKETPQTTPKTTPRNPDSFYKQLKPNFDENPMKSYGETLANRYFGDKFIKGFRWGYKLEKRIHSVAHKCEKFTQALKDSKCPPPIQPSPFPNSAIVNCIVEVLTLDETCLQPYEREQYPTEATCELDDPDKLVYNDCVRK